MTAQEPRDRTREKLGSEITDRIRLYRAKRGDAPNGDFEPLLHWLVNYKYGDQRRFTDPEEIEMSSLGLDVSGNDDGTWDEVERCYARGLLTRDEFRAVNSAVWEKYDPARAKALRDGTIR